MGQSAHRHGSQSVQQGGYAFDTGNVFPGAVCPRGMVAWSPDTTHQREITHAPAIPNKIYTRMYLKVWHKSNVAGHPQIPPPPTSP